MQPCLNVWITEWNGLTDYAYLKRADAPDDDEKCVARALLPDDINEGSGLAYEMLEYTLL